ncbi:hypothetical protein IFE09_11120 [Streptomyces microflavus]|uniref:hypothetical protein n=1 Tax=Streptomyces microflavus TaxID=1919 RepID=UPI00192B6B42|nr:hypothetical protein [Streptomyces microflavus]QQZ54108.1 hypothetical protein IFE09_11120 [Streptomyces microflavus]WSS36680.1 hypothetical protein OG269_25985 [Streptomyces microflavus]
MSVHLTEERVAAALGVLAQPEGETPWAELAAPLPLTHPDVCAVIYRAAHPQESDDVPTLQAEASRARIIRDMARRDSYMDAFSAAEELVATLPVLPAGTTIHNAVWHSEVYLSLRYHADADAVREVAAHLGLDVIEKPETQAKAVHVVAEGTSSNGVRFEAYTIIDAPAVEE